MDFSTMIADNTFNFIHTMCKNGICESPAMNQLVYSIIDRKSQDDQLDYVILIINDLWKRRIVSDPAYMSNLATIFSTIINYTYTKVIKTHNGETIILRLADFLVQLFKTNPSEDLVKFIVEIMFDKRQGIYNLNLNTIVELSNPSIKINVSILYQVLSYSYKFNDKYMKILLDFVLDHGLTIFDVTNGVNDINIYIMCKDRQYKDIVAKMDTLRNQRAFQLVVQPYGQPTVQPPVEEPVIVLEEVSALEKKIKELEQKLIQEKRRAENVKEYFNNYFVKYEAEKKKTTEMEKTVIEMEQKVNEMERKVSEMKDRLVQKNESSKRTRLAYAEFFDKYEAEQKKTIELSEKVREMEQKVREMEQKVSEMEKKDREMKQTVNEMKQNAIEAEKKANERMKEYLDQRQKQVLWKDQFHNSTVNTTNIVPTKNGSSFIVRIVVDGKVKYFKTDELSVSW